MKIINIVMIALLISSCSVAYIEPTSKTNIAQIKVKNNQALKECGAPFGTGVFIKVDNKRINDAGKENTIKVLAGKHTLQVTMYAYYNNLPGNKGNRAKKNSTKKYEVIFPKNGTITIIPKVYLTKIASIKDSVKAEINITGPNININEKITLNDSYLDSIACNYKQPIIIFM